MRHESQTYAVPGHTTLEFWRLMHSSWSKFI